MLASEEDEDDGAVQEFSFAEDSPVKKKDDANTER